MREFCKSKADFTHVFLSLNYVHPKLHKNNSFIYYILLIITVLSTSTSRVQAESVPDVDSLGYIWVITIDKSGSMISNVGIRTMTDNVISRLDRNPLINSINFSKDQFLFLTSGYSYNFDKGLGNELRKSSSFNYSFIHHTDSTLHKFENNYGLSDHLRRLMYVSNYYHQLSFVSQIRVFSIVKAIDFLKENNTAKYIRGIKIVTITDDADQNDQWLTDYKNLKRWAPGKIEEISHVNTHYIHNILNGKGHGYLEEIYSDDQIIPHILIYNYITKQSTNSRAHNDRRLCKIKALDGKNLEIIPLIDSYNNERINFFFMDSIFINQTKYIINKRFTDTLRISKLFYENGLHNNNVELHGKIQVEYVDTILNNHFKKYLFVQSAQLPTAYRIGIIYKAAVTTIVIIAIIVLWSFGVLPNISLFSFYDNQGRVFYIKRRRKILWKRGVIPILSYTFDREGCTVIHKKSKWIKQGTHMHGNIDDNEFLIVSRYQLTFSPNTLLTENDSIQDIYDFYINQSTKYKPIFKNIYEKTVQYRIREKLRETRNRLAIPFLMRSLSIANVFNRRRYYLLKNNNNKDLTIHLTISKWKEVTFAIEISEKSNEIPSNTFQKLNIQCMNDYYECKYRAKSLVGLYKTKECIYWTVILPEYKNINHNSLKCAYNIYQFIQKNYTKGESNTSLYIKLLERTIKKHTGSLQKNEYFTYTALEHATNKYNFKITETNCPGFVYLQEANDKKDKTLLYSPFKDGLINEKIVEVPRTAGSHLFISFTLYSFLKARESDKSLWRQLSDDIFVYNKKCIKYFQINETAVSKQIILDPNIININ